LVFENWNLVADDLSCPWCGSLDDFAKLLEREPYIFREGREATVDANALRGHAVLRGHKDSSQGELVLWFCFEYSVERGLGCSSEALETS
jgi:hypothetical protein